MKLSTLFIVFGFYVFAACGVSKTATVKPATALAAEKLIAYHKAASPSFTTLAARMYVTYETEEKSQGIAVNLRMEKGKKIWVKASILGITLAKALITPNRVRYYETVGNTYFEGNFSLLSHWLGTHITFEKAEAILLGQSIFNLTEGRFTSEATAAGYKIVPETQPENFIYGLTLNAENFKVRSETVSQPAENRLTVLRYTGYGAINGTV
ncbi:MAG: DUF4292 domain-containing protein, partial [Marinirhabdus sp.]